MVFLFVLLLVFILVITIRIKIEVVNIQFRSQKAKHHKLNPNYQCIVKLYTLKKIPIGRFKITKQTLEKINIKEKVKHAETKIIQDTNQFDKELLQAFKKLQVNIQQIQLKLEIGTEDAALTALLIPVISTGLVFLLKKPMNEKKEIVFLVNPIFANQNLLNIELAGIFELEMIHIINTICTLNKKKKGEKHERTSNRRSYDYSYE